MIIVLVNFPGRLAVTRSVVNLLLYELVIFCSFLNKLYKVDWLSNDLKTY